jgi:ubiquinone/menaquinone biosynthesis C-methylase UbiE
MTYLDEIDIKSQESGDLYDELPLWSAPFGQMLLDRVPLKPDLTVLDVGAGTGWLTIELAERCGVRARIFAVDPWKAGMDRLRRKLEYRGLTNVVLLETDAANIDLPNACVDVVVSNLGINNFSDPARVLQTCFRLAIPGGTLMLATNLTGHMAEFYEVYREVLIEGGQVDRLPILDAHIEGRGTVDSVSRMIEDAGFEMTDVVNGLFRMRFANGSSLMRHHFVRLGFVNGWKSVVAVQDLERTFAALERKLNALAEVHGELLLTIPMACLVARKQISV